MIKSLSIIFPIFNEELRLKVSFQHILTFLKKKKNFKIEIIFSDDGSNDNSLILIQKFIKNFKKFKTRNNVSFKTVRSKKNLGKGSALKLGVKKAKYEWILTTDIDMSVSLFQVSSWIKKNFINNEYNVYFGDRKHRDSLVDSNFIRLFLGELMSFLNFIILDIRILDTQCGYKLYKKSHAKLIFSKLKDLGFNHDLELVLLFKSHSIKIKELPVNWKHKDKSRLNIFWDPIKMLAGIFFMKLRYFNY